MVVVYVMVVVVPATTVVVEYSCNVLTCVSVGVVVVFS